MLEPFSISSIPGDSSNVFIGANDGNIYKYPVLSSGNFKNKNKRQVLTGHKSIVNTLDHKSKSNYTSKIQDLMLSGSFDWDVKLWDMR